MARLSRDLSVLDVYTHTGAFAIAAAAAGASSVLGLDRSEHAIDLARQAAAANSSTARAGSSAARLSRRWRPWARRRTLWRGDRGSAGLRQIAQGSEIGPQGLSQARAARRRLVAPGGFLMIASCSHNASVEDFASEVARGLRRGGTHGTPHPHLGRGTGSSGSPAATRNRLSQGARLSARLTGFIRLQILMTTLPKCLADLRYA